MALYDASEVLAVIANDNPVNVALSSGSAALILSALTTMIDRANWLDMNDTVWDDIDRRVSLAINEIMTSSTMESVNTMLFIDPYLMMPTNPITNGRLVHPASGSFQSAYYQILKPPAPDNAWLLQDIFLTSGDYALWLPVLRSYNSGKFDVSIAGNTSSIDNYDVSELWVLNVIYFTVATDGFYDLLIECTGKNAASSNYYFICDQFTIQRVP